MTDHQVVTSKPCASIAVFAFKRIDLLRQTLTALERCPELPDSPVYVFSDAAREGNRPEADAVARLRKWLRPWCAQHGASLDEAEANKGLRPSIVSGVTSLLERYDRVIVLEDDIVVSPRFLQFMNEGLEVCCGRTDIFQISGYNIPHHEHLPSVGLLHVPACWGWATWRRAWDYYCDDATRLLVAMRDRDVHTFDINSSYGYLEALERNASGTLNTWLVRWYASVFLQGGLAVYPGQSLTRNIGFGREGTNCQAGIMARTFLRQPIQRTPFRLDWQTLGTTETPSFAQALEEFYRWQQYQWTKPTWRQRLRSRWHRIVSARANA